MSYFKQAFALSLEYQNIIYIYYIYIYCNCVFSLKLLSNANQCWFSIINVGTTSTNWYNKAFVYRKFIYHSDQQEIGATIRYSHLPITDLATHKHLILFKKNYNNMTNT